MSTREEMREAIQAAVAPLPTREEITDWRAELRGYTQVMVEELRDETKVYLEALGVREDQLGRNFETLRARVEELARTDARQHAWASKTYGEMLEHFREYLKTHAVEHAEFRKKVEKIRATRAAKAAPKTSHRRKTS